MIPSTVFEAFAANAARAADAPFLCTESVTARAYDIPAGVVHWGEAAAEIERLRAVYARAGYGHGHRVGLLLENRPAFVLHWFALNALGVSVVPINAEMRTAELEYLIGHSEIGLAVCLPDRVADLQQAARRAGVAFHAVALDDMLEDVASDAIGGPIDHTAGKSAPRETPAAPRAARSLPAATPLAARRLPPAATRAPRAQERLGPQTECALLYTSGTTGRPKGCMLSNAYFLRAGQWYAELGGLATVRARQERVITPLPLSHMNAMACSTMVVVTTGGCLVQLDRFHPSTWWQSVRESRATIIHYLGVMPAMLLAASPERADRGHSVRWGFGAGVDRKNHALFEERFGFPLIEAWAMTETGAAACVMANHEPRHVGSSCFGRPEPFVDVRLVDEAGADVPDETPGELLVRSSGTDPRRHFYSGYLKDEAATAEAWAGGWFHTGDMVRRDADGNLYFVDRKKNVIRRSGENISAVEVESVLNQHPAVQASAVAATPDAVRGDEVLACIVTRKAVGESERAALARSIVEHALAELAYYKAPGYVAFVDALPLTASQKIQRGELRELALHLPTQLNCIDTRSMKKRQR